SIKNDGHYFCRAGGNRPDGLNEPVTVQIPEQINTLPDSLCCELVLPAGTLRLKGELTPALLQTLIREIKGSSH
ncbi:hypothetical protein ACPB0Q_24690, partial [Escherichia coli]